MKDNSVYSVMARMTQLNIDSIPDNMVDDNDLGWQRFAHVRYNNPKSIDTFVMHQNSMMISAALRYAQIKNVTRYVMFDQEANPGNGNGLKYCNETPNGQFKLRDPSANYKEINKMIVYALLNCKCNCKKAV